MAPGLRRLVVPSLLALPLLLQATAGAALERLQRRFDLERGLPFSEVYAVKQDTSGFIWIATGGGLFRYDGVELRPWPREPFRPFARNLATGPAGEVLLVGYTGSLFRVAGDGIAPVEGPPGAPFKVAGAPAWDARGILWVTTGDRLWNLRPGARWSDYPLARFDGRPIQRIDAGDSGDLLVLTDKALWRVGATLEAVRLVAREGVQQALVEADGSIFALLEDHVAGIRDGVERPLLKYPGRPIDMVQRGRTLWVSFDTGIAAVTPGRPPEFLGLAAKVPSGGPLLVDREGSLWVGTFRGLLQYPVPETVAWGSDERLGNGTRRLARAAEGIWVDTWSGLGLMRRLDGAWRAQRVNASVATSALCVASDGALWIGGAGRALERQDGRFVVHPAPGITEVRDCSAGAGGRVWLSGFYGLAVAGPPAASARAPAARAASAAPARPVALPPGADFQGGDVKVHEDSSGRLWVAARETICHAEARSVASGSPVDWSCATAAGAGGVTSLAEVSAGSIWATSLLAGVYRLAASGDAWEVIPAARELPTRVVRRAQPSPSGGAWIISYGTILRVAERPGSVAGWEVVERPSAWHGLMISDAEDVLEDPSGDLWITTLAGLVHIPAEVRRARPPVPPVELVDVLVDGEPLAWRSGVDLPWRRNRIELRFAGLSYRDPALLRYQVRLRSDGPWIDASGRPSFLFVDLPPGTYHAEVRASLDGEHWSEQPAGLAFRVRPPFWRTWWFTTAVALAAAALAYALYRFRLAQVLRLERTRTRIAADLHDDIGASLSRIALQSELLKRPAILPPPDAERLLSDIGASARALVDGMSDIVWSIDPKRDDLASLAARARQFALGLFEPLGITLTLRLPEDAARLRLGPEHRRHLYLFIKEAANNIARHAAARQVVIELGVDAGRLVIDVTDDGRGFTPPVDTQATPAPARRGGGGHGLPSMRARAALLHGTLSIRSAPGGGTTLRLVCPIANAAA
jgi:signal transduction histidine kinase